MFKARLPSATRCGATGGLLLLRQDFGDFTSQVVDDLTAQIGLRGAQLLHVAPQRLDITLYRRRFAHGALETVEATFKLLQAEFGRLSQSLERIEFTSLLLARHFGTDCLLPRRILIACIVVEGIAAGKQRGDAE